MNVSLFQGLTAYFSEKTPSLMVQIWQMHGGEITFIPDYQRPDLWFGLDAQLVKKKKTLHERWIVDSISSNQCLPYHDYYAMNQSRLKRRSSLSLTQKTEDLAYFILLMLLPILNPKKKNVSSDPHNHLLSTSFNQTTETSIFDSSLSHDSLFSYTQSSSYTDSSEILNSPIEKTKILALEDLESAIDIFEVIAAQKIHNPEGINRIFLKKIFSYFNDRLGKKIRVKCNEDDTVGDLKKLIAAQTGTHWQKIVLKKWYKLQYNTFKDHITLSDYEIHNLSHFGSSSKQSCSSGKSRLIFISNVIEKFLLGEHIMQEEYDFDSLLDRTPLQASFDIDLTRL
ncbi:hypothetical protein PCK1_002562 [Pneumocystis canis]|nr:hypothetical protein PCK1_002562 [Pneumocystis canis]